MMHSLGSNTEKQKPNASNVLELTSLHSRYINITMKYRLVHITENGPYDYTLRIEERISVWSRFFSLKEPRIFIIRGDGRGYWEHRVSGIDIPHDVCEFANRVMQEYGERIRLRK